MTSYIYSVADDTANGAVLIDALVAEINASSVQSQFSYINLSEDVLDINCGELSAAEEAALDAVVAAHTAQAHDVAELLEVHIGGEKFQLRARRIVLEPPLETADRIIVLG